MKYETVLVSIYYGETRAPHDVRIYSWVDCHNTEVLEKFLADDGITNGILLSCEFISVTSPISPGPYSYFINFSDYGVISVDEELESAFCHKNFAAVANLLQAGIDPNLCGKYLSAPTHYYEENDKNWSDAEVEELFIALFSAHLFHPASIPTSVWEIILTNRDLALLVLAENGRIPPKYLAESIGKIDKELFRAMLNSAVNINGGRPPLWSHVLYSPSAISVDHLRLFLEYGAQLVGVDVFGMLSYNSNSTNVFEMSKILLNCGVDPNCTTHCVNRGVISSVYYACRMQQPQLAILLLAAGAKVTDRDFHQAVHCKFENVVQWMIFLEPNHPRKMDCAFKSAAKRGLRDAKTWTRETHPYFRALLE